LIFLILVTKYCLEKIDRNHLINVSVYKLTDKESRVDEKVTACFVLSKGSRRKSRRKLNLYLLFYQRGRLFCNFARRRSVKVLQVQVKCHPSDSPLPFFSPPFPFENVQIFIRNSREFPKLFSPSACSNDLNRVLWLFRFCSVSHSISSSFHRSDVSR